MTQTKGQSSPRDALTRRGFLGRAGGVAAATLGVAVPAPLPMLVPSIVTVAVGEGDPSSGHERANQALGIRVDAAQEGYALPLPPHPTNGDDELYANKIGSFCKGLRQKKGTTLGEVDPLAYTKLLQALSSGQPVDFEAIPLGGTVRLANPQAAYAFVLEGPDSHQLGTIPPPTFKSAWEASEMAEDYWMALTRDVPFVQYGSDTLGPHGSSTTAAAVTDLNTFTDFRGPKDRITSLVSPATLFRGQWRGDLAGPFISQFLWLDVPYGAMKLHQHYPTVAASADYMVTYPTWVNIQQGSPLPAESVVASTAPARYISTGRDLAAYVHSDFTYQAYLNACLILLGLHAQLDTGNPYLSSKTQSGFATFGAPHVLDLVGRAANAALKATWFQKWLVHRRVRPEAFGGCVQFTVSNTFPYPINPELLNSAALGQIASKYGTYFLPQAYPEGCPVHPAFPAGHAAIAGACVTMLKAFLDESLILAAPIMALPDGSALVPYPGPAQLTVGGELNKLASNISLGRDFAGVHWRSDGIEGMKLGEAVAIGILTDQRASYTENFGGFSLTKFDGTTITV